MGLMFQKGHGLNIGNQYAKGMKHTDEWKLAAKERMLGNTMGFKKGEPSPRKGKKSSKPAWNKGKKMLSPSKRKGRKFPEQSGANRYNWIADRTKVIGRHNRNFHDPEYKQWRKRVWERDNYKCKITDSDCNGRIEAHHILRWKDFPKLRYEVNNGITLCHFHHPRKRTEEDRLIPTFLTAIDLAVPHLI